MYDPSGGNLKRGLDYKSNGGGLHRLLEFALWRDR